MPAAQRAPAVAPQTPFSHHDILALVGPFTLSGRRVDLPASDRLARCLHFKPQARGEAGGLVEQLTLEDIGRSGYALTRLLTRPDGTQATLLAEGPDIATLLRWVDAVPAAAHWLAGPGWSLVLHHRLNPPPRTARGAGPVGGAADAAAAAPERVLTAAQGRVAGLLLQATVSRVKNVPVDITLQTAEGAAAPVLPEDLLAVQGLDWSRLVRIGSTWRASLRVKGAGAVRSANATAHLQQGMAHLALTLGAPPAHFHPHFAAARWRVMLRRGFPLLVCLGLIGASAAVPWMGITRDSVYQMLVFNAPPILMVWLFSMRELPRIEIPPLPRPLAATAWTPASVQHDHGVAG